MRYEYYFYYNYRDCHHLCYLLLCCYFVIFCFLLGEHFVKERKYGFNSF